MDHNLVELKTFARARIEVPSCFISGASDWGLYQTYGAIDAMPRTGCSRLLGIHIVPGAGHWVQQEQPEVVLQHLCNFFKQAGIPFNC